MDCHLEVVWIYPHIPSKYDSLFTSSLILLELLYSRRIKLNIPMYWLNLKVNHWKPCKMSHFLYFWIAGVFGKGVRLVPKFLLKFKRWGSVLGWPDILITSSGINMARYDLHKKEPQGNGFSLWSGCLMSLSYVGWCQFLDTIDGFNMFLLQVYMTIDAVRFSTQLWSFIFTWGPTKLATQRGSTLNNI